MPNSWTPQPPFSPYSPYGGQARGPTAPSSNQSALARRVHNASTLTPPAAPRLRPIPLPLPSVDDASLNVLVTYASRPRIVYDVRYHPGYASAPTGGENWSEEAATDPPVLEMVIVCMILPRPFTVVATSRALNYVTVGDLLAATHDEFREAAREAEPGGENWGPGFSIWSGTSNSRYTWAGLSEQTAPYTWLLHIE